MQTMFIYDELSFQPTIVLKINLLQIVWNFMVSLTSEDGYEHDIYMRS